jgi:hypothetical protein
MRLSKPKVAVIIRDTTYKISRTQLAIGAAVLVGVHWNVIKRILNIDNSTSDSTTESDSTQN